jgi:hypothetical protein
MIRSNVLALSFLAALAAAATPALADRGGNGNGNGPGGGSASSSIELATVNGTPMSAAVQSPIPQYGDSLTFATTVERLAGWEYPLVALSCYQDVNQDGTVDTNLLGPDIVFGLLDRPDATFTLAGSSKWAQRGGDAVCRADLDAYGSKGGQESIRVLDATENWTATW